MFTFSVFFVWNPIILVTVLIGPAYQGKEIVFRFIIEYSSWRDFGP
jgi:hypothetical protein